MNKGCLYVLLGFIVIVLIGAGFTFFYLYEKEQEEPMDYRTEKPMIDNIIRKTVATGSVVPRKEILIKSQISGIIREIYVEAGDTVKEGDIIAQIKVIPDMVSMNNAENRLNRAQISLENAKIDYDRNKALLDQKVIAPADFQPFEVARRQAIEELSAAEDNLQIVRDGVAKRGSATSNTLIRATIGGMVLDVPVEVGNSVIEANNFNEGTTIAAIADMNDLIFEGRVDETEVEKLGVGMDIILKIGAIDKNEYKAALEYISPKGVDENGAILFQIRAAVKLNPGEFIRAGYSANADVVLDRRDSVLTISEALVQFGDSGAFVEVLNNGTYEKRDIKLGLSDGLRVEVLEGVSEQDEIKLWNQPIKK